MAGVNRFGQASYAAKNAHGVSPTVFVSHSSKDKQAARIIANRLKSRNVDIYFDEEDRCLGTVTGSDRDKQVVQCIQQGIKGSTHTLCILSVNSLRSPWVSYEIGYAASEKHPLGVLVLKDVENPPSFIKVAQYVLTDIWDLETFIIRIKNEPSEVRDEARKQAAATDLVSILPNIRGSIVYGESGS